MLQPPFAALMKDVHQQGGDSQEQQHAQKQPEGREGQGGGEGMVKQVKDLGEPFGHKSTSFSLCPIISQYGIFCTCFYIM